MDRLQQIEAMTDSAIKKLEASKCLSTGCTLLNLSCTGMPHVGIPMGTYVFFVGDSDSGKTFYTLTILAEAANSKRFDDYDLIYDCPEFGTMADEVKFFGTKLGQRLSPPFESDDGVTCSETVEEFYDGLDERLDRGDKFIYVLDSMDSLTSEAEIKKTAKQQKERESGKPVTGSHGDGKAKVNSARIRRITPKLARTGSILIIINQTRDNPAAGPFEPTKTRSGGKALKFYAALEIWTSVKGQIKKTVRGKDRQLGINVRVQVKKNHINGRLPTIIQPILWSVGIDDLGGVVEFLIDEKEFKKPRGSKNITADAFDFQGTPEKLIQHIESTGQQKELRKLAAKVWNDIDEACQVERSPRYA